MLIGAEGEFWAGERGNKEKKSRVGEVEVREQTAHAFKFVGGIDKCRGGALMGIEGGGRFEDTSGGGAYGNKLFGGSGFFGESRWNLIVFRVHKVITKVLSFDGSKSSETYVESDKGVGKLSEELGCKVQAGGWCGHGARGLGVCGLVVGWVGGLEVGLSVGFSGFENIGGERR